MTWRTLALAVRRRVVASAPDAMLRGARRTWARSVQAQLRRRGFVTNDRGTRLYVDPDDERALWLARAGGATNRSVVRLWQRLLGELRPALVLDIGANYGEVAFSATYPGDATIHLIEANPALCALLTRTIDGVGDPSFVLHPYAASDVDGDVLLRIRDASSGLSSLQPGGAADRGVTVRARRVDDLVDSKPGRHLVFKIDVEGHELAVLRGMSRLLEDHEYAGVVEAWPGSEKEIAANHAVHIVDRRSLEMRRVDEQQLTEHLRAPSREHLRDVVVTRLPRT